MQRSSELIGAIAGALAKAQGELTNPEKSLVATLRSSNPRENDRTFRYAALSTGLDIVRKTLGSHEIATVQTTAIDRDARLIRLTTVLAHSSGEWLSSEWPVCTLSELAAPSRMGAALTYARRYALFTLVGIAGEDDLDAPDLDANATAASRPPAGADVEGSANGASPQPDTLGPANGPRGRRTARAPIIMLSPNELAAQRDRLLAEIAQIQAGEDAAAWAQPSLPIKNRLTVSDAQNVEAEFRARLAAITGVDGRREAAEGAPPATQQAEQQGAS